MKRLLALMACACLGGCSLFNTESDLAASINTAWVEIGPEYRAYVANDPALDASSKAIRTRTADLMDSVLADALGTAGGN